MADDGVNRVCLSVEISVTDREHGDRPSSTQLVLEHFRRLPYSSRRYLPMQPVVSDGLQLPGMPLFNAELYSATLSQFMPM
jgi:hypothetical protein